MKVTVMARIREGNKYPFVDPMWKGNKLKPGAVIVKDATGKKIEVKRDDVTYYLRYTRHGKQVTEPAGKNPKDVLTFRERILATLEAEAHGLAVSGGNIIPMPQSAPDSSRTTIQQAVADFLTRKAQDPDLRRSTVGGYANTLGQWLGWCRKQNLDEVVRDDVWGFRTHLWKTAKKTNGKPYAERTANNKTQEVASFLNDVGRPGLLTARDWQMMDPGPSTRIPYSKDEIKALRAACETEDERDVIEFYPGLGLRKGEGYQTKWTDVDFTNRYIRVGVSYQTKDKDPRNVPMGPALIERLKARRKRHPDTVYVFPNTKGGPDTHIDRVVARVAKRAGVSMVGKSITHSFRKTYATRLKNDAKTPIYKIMKLLGHEDLETTERYLGGYDPDSETVGEDIEKALG